MPHIHTEPGQIDHTVTAFIVRLDGAEPRLLLHIHKKYQRLMPVGGHIELHETPWAAVAHEILEEAGYGFGQLAVLQPRLRIDALPNVVEHPLPFRFNTHLAAENHYHTDIAYLFTTQEEPVHAPGEDESTDIRWLTRAEIVALPDETMHPDAKQTAQAIFDHFLQHWEAVPTSGYALTTPGRPLA